MYKTLFDLECIEYDIENLETFYINKCNSCPENLIDINLIEASETYSDLKYNEN